ncbi:MAG: isochorismatase family protein [Rhodospirillaceae bacterium]
MHKIEIDPFFLDRARKIRAGRLNAYEKIEPAKTALVVVDMQDFFVADGMPSCVPLAKTIVPNINRLAAATRAAGGLVVWVQTDRPETPDAWANRRESNSEEVWNKRVTLLAQGGAGYPIYHTCAVDPADAVAIKYRYSAFIPYPSPLSELLATRGIDTLLITGTATSTCCESTARDASMWGFRTVMVTDGNADGTDALHNHTLGKFLATFGDIRSTDELVAMLAGKAPAATAAE